MRIPVPWPAPERGIAYPTEARYIFLQSGPTLDEAEKVGLVIVDCFTPEGLFAAEWEASLWELRKRYPGMQVILQATALPPALIFPDKWGELAYLVHGPTWERLHSLPLPPPDPKAHYQPAGEWHFISPAYEPPRQAYTQLNAFLQALQAWRRILPAYNPQKSSLFYTMAERLYTHFSPSELNAYVASLRS